MIQLSVYVPLEHAEKVKLAMFEAGAGKIGDYDQCCFETIGQGQYRPLKGSQPFLGETHKLEIVQETKIEMVIDRRFFLSVIAALKQAHPYETPAYHAVELLDC
jgi:hypothetical protein